MSVSLLGLPFDGNVSFEPGPAAAPAAIRAAFDSGHWHRTTELGLDLDEATWTDAGDVLFGGSEPPLDRVFSEARRLGDERKVLALGGDHSLSAPLIRAAAELHGPLTVLLVDAHTDLYDELDGDRDSHGSPFARAYEAGAIARLVQVGIRTLNDPTRAQVERFGVEVVTMREWPIDVVETLEGPLYVSLDLDGLDPAFAPGVSHPEPGGLTTREVIDIVQRLPVSPVAGDIVELNPVRDQGGLTAFVAAKLLKELLGRMLSP